MVECDRSGGWPSAVSRHDVRGNFLNGIPRSSGLADMFEGSAPALPCVSSSLFMQR